MLPEQIRISGKELGQMALSTFCPRCFWMKLRNAGKLPFQRFPGIFSSIDSYTKKVVHGYFDRYGQCPQWLSEIGDVVGYREPPHFNVFRIEDSATNVLLTGAPDGVLVRRDGSIVIIDYKTARFTDNQDSLLPEYVVQLNSYALIAEKTGMGKVSGISLVYMEPVTSDAAASDFAHEKTDGFMMGFSACVKSLDLKMEMVRPLLKRLRDLHDLESPPDSRLDCRDCELLRGLIILDRWGK